MEAVQLSEAGLSMAESLAQRRLALHVQCIRSAAATNPQLIAALIRKWLREDGR